jgi:O-antigen/teichoic acid export membrane protein
MKLGRLSSFLKKNFSDIFPSKEKIKRFYGVSLYRNASYLMLNSVVGAILGFFFWIVVARLYTTSEVGLVSALLASMGLLNSLSFFGFDIGMTRFLPDEKDKAGMINSCFTIIGASVMVLSMIFILGAPIWSPAIAFVLNEPTYLLIFMLLTLGSSIYIMLSCVFVALRAAYLSFVTQTIMGVLKIVFAVMLVRLGTMGIFSSWGLASLIALLVGDLVLLRVALPGYAPRLALKRGILNEIVHFSASNYFAEAIASLPAYLLPIMVVNLLGVNQSAYYRIAYGIAVVLWALPNGVITALFAEGSTKPKELHTNAIKAIKFILLFLVPTLLIILFLGDKILLLFGQKYSENAFRLLQLLSLSSIPMSIAHLYIVIKRVELNIKPVIYLYSAMAIFIIGGCLGLMRQFDITGVGIGWILGYGIIAVVAGAFIIKWFKGSGSG